MAEVKHHKNGLQAKLDASGKQVRDLERLSESQRQQIVALEQTVLSLRGSEQELDGEVQRLQAELRHVQSVHDKVDPATNPRTCRTPRPLSTD